MIIDLPKKVAKYIWFNGRFVESSHANISMLTHSLHYSGAVFEGERAYNGKIFKLREHTERLIDSANTMSMRCPYDIEDIIAAHESFLIKNKIDDAYIRPLIFKGSESLNITNSVLSVNLMITAIHATIKKVEEFHLHIARWRKPLPEACPPQVKSSGHYNMMIVVQEEAKAAQFDDAILLDSQGYIAECTTSNIFFVKDNDLYTPIPDVFLNGITRQAVIEIANIHDINVIEKRIELKDIENFTECFVTGTALEVKKVNSIDLGNKKAIFNNCKITDKIQSEFLKLVRT